MTTPPKLDNSSTQKQQAILDGPLRPGGKLDTATTMRLASGLPVKAVASANKVSQKTARAFYLECRDNLRKPRYRRWHSLSLLIPFLPPDVTLQSLPKVAFFDVVAQCHDNETCHRNYRLGNRKSRFCRACPLASKFTHRPRQVEAIKTIEAVQDFYRLLGLRKEQGADPVANFRHRLLHLSVISQLRAKSAKRSDGTLDPADMSYEGIGTFLLMLMDDLTKPPETKQPEMLDWLLDDGSIISLPVGQKPI